MTNNYDFCKGKFIVFEGSEGVGKTTNLFLLSKKLTENKVEHITTREPGGTKIGEKIREIFLSQSENNSEKILPITELLFMFAARAQHIENVIIPALKNNKCVLCDRFTDASYAYQGGGREVDNTIIDFLAEKIQKDLSPDLILLFDLPIEVGMSRAKNRGELDRIEQEEKDFFKRVRQAYLLRSSNNPDLYSILDASKSLDLLAKDIYESIGKLKNQGIKKCQV